jgi:parvulin-like peptidyl-prolyl isomerase
MAQVRAAHLLIKHIGSRNPVSRRTGLPVALGPAEAARELELYEQKIRSEGLDSFSRYAKERSDCGSYANGGDLGFFGPGMFASANRLACSAMEVATYP